MDYPDVVHDLYAEVDETLMHHHEDLERLAYVTQMTCTRKSRYRKRADAERVATMLRKDWNRHQFAYKCPFCNGYHLSKRRLADYRRHVKVQDYLTKSELKARVAES
jgi:hypothetical protein